MTYRFKFNQELFWFCLVGVLTVLAQTLIDFDGNKITDWRVWAVGVASACVRALMASVIAWMGKGSFTASVFAIVLLALSSTSTPTAFAQFDDPGHHGEYPLVICEADIHGKHYTTGIGFNSNHPQITAADLAYARDLECPTLLWRGAMEAEGDVVRYWQSPPLDEIKNLRVNGK